MSIRTDLTKLSVLSTVTIFVLSAVTMLLVSFGTAQADNFGAIAYSRAAGTHGYSYNYATQWAAENAPCRNASDTQAQETARSWCGLKTAAAP